MNNRICFRFIAVAFLVVSLPLTTSCSHKKAKPDDDMAASRDSNMDLVSSDRGDAHGLTTVHFGFDSQLLDGAAKTEIKANSEILKANPTLRVQIEGHCDSRGGIQYNIALGEKRAMGVKHYLQDLGISSERIDTISYGKERPLDAAETEEAYAKNRRANFVVTKE